MVSLIQSNDLENVLKMAQTSKRLRQHKNLHDTYSDACQILFNAIEPGSYIPPHRHLIDPKVETLIAFKGRFLLVTFTDSGDVFKATVFSSDLDYDCVGVRLEPEVWHTVLSIDPGGMLLEIKPGPFDPLVAKEIASWAPNEGVEGSSAYYDQLRLFADSLL